MLERQIERISQSRQISKLIVATSEDTSDDPLEALCRSLSVEVFRGSLTDVLDRYYQVARAQGFKTIVRLTGDCPLTDPAVIDAVIQHFHSDDFDYVNNTMPPSFPDGLDVEVMRFAVLERIWKEAKLPSQREHVSLFIYQNPKLFKLGNWKNNEDLSGMRWTVDEPEDFLFVQKIYEALYPNNSKFTMQDVLELLKKNPSLLAINSQFERNEGLKKSLANDKK